MKPDEASARAAAEAHLRSGLWRLPAGDEVVVHVLQDRGDFWLVFYNSRRFVETGDHGAALVGNCPLIVDSEGRVHASPIAWGNVDQIAEAFHALGPDGYDDLPRLRQYLQSLVRRR